MQSALNFSKIVRDFRLNPHLVIPVEENDDPRLPRIVARAGPVAYGIFHNSFEGISHIAAFVPWQHAPFKRVCGREGENFSPSRSKMRPICEKCQQQLEEMSYA